ncbi:hypothetical protein HKX48_006872 [Thoreauomyces humboldtii]|nr:hypothetical protein HKX48_006872 [Thoreauomyces humboldtii]
METPRKNAETIFADTPARFEIRALRAVAARHAFQRTEERLSLKEFVEENFEAVRAHDISAIFRALACFRQVHKDLSHEDFSALCAAGPAQPAAAAPSSSSSSSSSTDEYTGPSVVPAIFRPLVKRPREDDDEDVEPNKVPRLSEAHVSPATSEVEVEVEVEPSTTTTIPTTTIPTTTIPTTAVPEAVFLCRAITDMLASGAITPRQAREARAAICRDERTRLVVALYDRHLSGEDGSAMTAINDISPPQGKWYAGLTPQAARKWVIAEAIALVRGYTRNEIKRWVAGIVASAAVNAVIGSLFRR